MSYLLKQRQLFRQAAKDADAAFNKSDSDYVNKKISEQTYKDRQNLIGQMHEKAVESISSKNRDKFADEMINESHERGGSYD